MWTPAHPQHSTSMTKAEPRSGTAESSAGERGTGKKPPALRRMVEHLLLIAGVALLAIYLGGKLRGTLLSRAGVQQFEALKQASPDNLQSRTQLPGEVMRPNFVLWSEKRIGEYRDSLDQHLGSPLAVLRIPKIHLEVPVWEGTDDLTLNRGVGWIQGTAPVGNDGNIGLAGHRDGFFRGLKDLRKGDQVELEGRQRTDTYIVDEIEIVDPKNVGVLRPRSKPSLTLVTCYPFYFVGSAPKRYIVHASRMNSEQQKTTEQASLTLQKLQTKENTK